MADDQHGSKNDDQQHSDDKQGSSDHDQHVLEDQQASENQQDHDDHDQQCTDDQQDPDNQENPADQQCPKSPKRILNFEPAFDREGLALCLSWRIEDVAEWIEHIGFPQYKECFTTNFINGRKLICIDCSSLPKIGITDFQHMKIISAKIRELLDVEYTLFERSISLPPREPKTLFLERKSVTGAEADAVTLEEHLRELKQFYLHGVPENHSL